MSGSAILTNTGLLKIASASPLDQLTITDIAVGDGVNPLSPTATGLVNEVYRNTASTPIRSTTYPDTLVFELNIPPTTGGFTVREIGAFDTDGDLIAVGTLDAVTKPADGINLTVRINVRLQTAAQVDVFYDNQGAIDFEGLRNRNASSLNNNDGLTAQNTHDATKAILIAQGLSGNYGFFEKGFTYNLAGDAGIDTDGKIYTYAGSDPLPVNVTAETDPAGDGDYYQISFNKNISYYTLAEVQATNIEAGQQLILTDYSDAPCEIVTSGHTGGYYYGVLLNGNKVKLKLDINNVFSRAEWFGFGKSGNTPTENSLALQVANDAIAGMFTVVNGFGNGGSNLYIPSGQHKFEGFTISNGVNVKGTGKNKTVLRLIGDNKTGIKNASADTGLSANQVQYGIIEGMSIIPDEPNRVGLTGQVMLDAVGFSRFTFRDLFLGWCGGAVGVRATGSPTAGTGGPAMWYNDWYNCTVERASGWNAGGVGWLLGEADNALEQITTWTIIGGRTSGAGTGINIQGANTVTFLNHTIEGTDVIIGSAAGPRVTRNINFYPAYLEGSASFTNNSPSCAFFGEFITIYTVLENQKILTHGTNGFYSVVRSAGTGQWEVGIENGSVKRPKFKGSTFPAIDIINSNLSSNDITIANGRNISDSTSILTIRKDGNATVVFEVGNDFMRAGSDGALNVGSPANRMNTVYATNSTINTSDEREKQQMKVLTPELMAVAKRIMGLNKTYKWNNSVEEKGGDARTHIGLIAQEVISAFEAEGLSAFDYGAVCYDEWEDEYETLPAEVDGQGNTVTDGRAILRVKSGNRYGLRFQQLNELRFAYINSVLDGLEV